MGWLAFTRKGDYLEEEQGIPRPTEEGKKNELLLIGQKDFGHSVAVHLDHGEIALDWTFLKLQNGTFEMDPKIIFSICDDTNIVAGYKHLKQEFVPWYNCFQTKFIPWFKCDQKKHDDINGEIECDQKGNDKPGKCPDGHDRIEGTKEVACDTGNSDPKKLCDLGHERKQVFHPDLTSVTVRNDILTDLIWRPIWYTRGSISVDGDGNAMMGGGGAMKVIGAQTTTPKDIDTKTGKDLGSKNIKRQVILYDSGAIGID